MSIALRAAIAMHPAAWREKHGDVVLSTLMDVADERGGRVPVGETLNLGLRGLWLRVRRSVAFWACLAIVGIMIAAAANPNAYLTDGSLTGRLLMLDGGLGAVLVVLGALGGWTGARARIAKVSPAGARLRRLAVDSVPPLVATVIGCLVALVIFNARFGLPWIGWPAGLVVAGQVACVLAALAIGEILGATLPRVLAIFVAPAAVGATALVWGTALGFQYWGPAYLVDVEPFLQTYVAATLLIAVAMATVAVRSQVLRAVPALAVVVGAAVMVSAFPASEFALRPLVERSQSALVCSASQPIVCMWPEQDAAFGDAYRRTLSDAYATGLALGLPVDDVAPRSVARFAFTGISAPQHEGMPTYDEMLSEFGLGVGGLAPDDIVSLYAYSVPLGWADESFTGKSEMYALQFSIAILLGIDRDKAWPAVPDPYTGNRMYDPAGIPDEAAARALVERWLASGLDGVRPPS